MNNLKTIPDFSPDDRITCRQCHLLRGSHFCSVNNAATMIDLPRRCEWFKPKRNDPDPRTGKERWPELLILTEKKPQIADYKLQKNHSAKDGK